MRDKLRQFPGDAPWRDTQPPLIALNAGKGKLYLRDFEMKNPIQKGEMLRWKMEDGK